MDIYKMLETAAHRAYQRGIQTGSGGNLSARTSCGMIVKSSGGSFADCWSDGRGFVETSLDGKVIGNLAGKPTREVFLHGLVYRMEDQIGGVMHCHSPWAITWSYGKKDLPITTLHAQLKLGRDIAVVDVPSANVRPEDEELIRTVFCNNPELKGFILVGHGIVAVGKDVLEAEHNAELIEETAQITVLKNMMNCLKAW